MNAKRKSAALAVVMMAGLLAAGAASAQIVVGGGSTLAEPLYDEILPSGVGLTAFSYTGNGSGAGKAAFFADSAAGFDNESLPPSPTLAAPLPNPWPATQPAHFAGSDSLVTASELASYTATHQSTWGRMIQLPSAGTSVVLPYKRAGIVDLNLTDAQMCAVFANKPGAQTWGQLRGTPDGSTVKIVFRLDLSGTTELLSRYLVAACPGAGFVVSNNFTSMVAGAIVGGVIPSQWVGVAGSGGMSFAMLTDSRIGYLSPDPLYVGSSNAVISRINGNLPNAASIRAALATQSLPIGGSTNPLAWVPSYAKPSPASGPGSIYPIFGTTQLLVGQCYMDATVQAKIKNFLTDLYGTAYDSQIAAHNLVTLPDGTGGGYNWKFIIKNVFLNSASPLGIGNVNACNGVGRP